MTTTYVATVDMGRLAQPYEGLLVDPPVITRSLTDDTYGFLTAQEIEFTLKNGDGRFTPLFLSGLRGVTAIVKSYDEVAGSPPVDEWVGMITQDALQEDGTLWVRGINLNRGALTQRIPKVIVTTTLWPTAVDVGAAVPVVFGTVDKLKLIYVAQNEAASQFDYLVAHGTVTVLALYQDGLNVTTPESGGGAKSFQNIDPSEYTVSTAIVPGYTAVRFTVKRQSPGGALAGVYADVSGFTDRNPVRTAELILDSDAWGTMQLVNAASFDAAAALHDLVNDRIVCDGALVTQKPAAEYLRQLAQVGGLTFGMNSAGEWIVSVDSPRESIALALRSPGLLVRAGRRIHVPDDDRIKTYTLQYRLDLPTNRWLFLEQREVDTAGREFPETNEFIREPRTAQRVADRVGRRLFYGQDRIEDVEVSMEGAGLREGDLVTHTYTPLGTDEDIYEVHATTLDYASGRIELTLGRWSYPIHHPSSVDTTIITPPPPPPITDTYVPPVEPINPSPVVGSARFDFPSGQTPFNLAGPGWTLLITLPITIETTGDHISVHFDISFNSLSADTFAYGVSFRIIDQTTATTVATTSATVGSGGGEFLWTQSAAAVNATETGVTLGAHTFTVEVQALAVPSGDPLTGGYAEITSGSLVLNEVTP